MTLMPRVNNRVLQSACIALALAYPSLCVAQAVGDLVSADATVKGSVQTVSTGTRIMSGSSVSAGSTTAAIKLMRGGEIHVCPRSNVSLTTSASGRDLAVALGTGGLETHFRLRSSADTIMTPDFRILLAGPGNFEYAIAADTSGNTCVRALADNTASLIVSEIMGDGTYQVTPGEQVYFRNGSVANPGNKVPPDCGCPPPFPVMNAAQPTPQPSPVTTRPTPEPGPEPQPAVPAPAQAQPAEQTKLPANSPEALFAQLGHPGAKPEARKPAATTKEIHVQVDAPMIIHGDAPRNAPPPPSMATLRLVELPNLIAETQNTRVLPPAKFEKQDARKQTAAKLSKPHRGLFGHIKSFFGSIFR